MTNRLHTAWERIFSEKQFDTTSDLHFITANDIKTITGEEARLMAKFDSSKERPPIFVKNGYFLLPVKNGKYAIVRGEGFHLLEKLPKTQDFQSRVKFSLETMDRSTSEMQYLDYSHSAGVIESIIGRGTLYPSIRGRERSGDFSFIVNNIELNVSQTQIEVDLGLEGRDTIVLLEGKSKTPEDFIIRQLYYPYRRFRKLAPNKEIVPVFFTFDNTLKAYNYWVYKFDSPHEYSSLSLVANYSYTISTANVIGLEDILATETVYKDVIPQADDLDKVQELIFRIKEGVNNAFDVAEYFGFDRRQSSYYRDAAEALGFVKLQNGRYYLTDSGERLTTLDTQQRNLYFSQVISNFTLVRFSLEQLKGRGEVTKEDLIRLVERNSHLTGTTIVRRAQTLYAWLKWLAANTGVCKVSQNGSIIQN